MSTTSKDFTSKGISFVHNEFHYLSLFFSSLSSISSSYVTDRQIKPNEDTIENNPIRMKAVFETFRTENENSDDSENENILVDDDADDSDHDSTNESQTEANQFSSFLQSSRSMECLNEFTSNDKIIPCSFMPTFLLGKFYDRHGSLSFKQHRHILLQYTGHAARNKELIFFLFNQAQRHGNTRGVKAVVRSNKESFKRFSDLVIDENFKKKIRKAKKNPEGKTAKEIMETVATVLTIGGNKTDLGSVERNETIMKINATCLRYGMPTLFLTIAIDDVNNFNS